MASTQTDIIQISWHLTRTLRDRGWDIIDCGRGNPSHPASREALAAMQEVIQDQEIASLDRAESIQYGATGGEATYRARIAELFTRDYGRRAEFRADDVMCVHGGKAALLAIFTVIRSIAERCTIVLQSPGYPYYRRLLGRAWDSHPIDVHELRGDASQAFRLNFGSLASTLEQSRLNGGRHAMVVLSDPCNPTGVKLTRGELESFADVCRNELRHGTVLWIILDESFHAMVFPSYPRAWLLEVAPDLIAHTVLLRSGTKDMGLAADRLAALCVPPSLSPGVRAYLTDTGLTAAPLHQAGFAAGLSGMTLEGALAVGAYYEERALAFRRILERSRLLSSAALETGATFFVPVQLAALRNMTIAKDVALAMAELGHPVGDAVRDDVDLMCVLMGGGAILDQKGVAVVPMNGGPLDSGWFRVCIGGSIEQVEEAARRLVAMADCSTV